MKCLLIFLLGCPAPVRPGSARFFDSHPNTPYPHEPNSGRALKAMPLIAPIANADKYRPITVPLVELLEEMNTPRAACAQRHTRVKDSVIPPSHGYWISSSGYLPYIKLNYLSSRFNFAASIIGSIKEKGGRYGTGKLGLGD